MAQLALADIEKTLAEAVDAKQQHTAYAGGTALVWVEAPNGLVIVVADGDHDEVFSPRDGKVECDHFIVEVYRSEDDRLDGGDCFDMHRVPATPDLAALAMKVKEMAGRLHVEREEMVAEYDRIASQRGWSDDTDGRLAFEYLRDQTSAGVRAGFLTWVRSIAAAEGTPAGR